MLREKGCFHACLCHEAQHQEKKDFVPPTKTKSAYAGLIVIHFFEVLEVNCLIIFSLSLAARRGWRRFDFVPALRIMPLAIGES